MKTVVVHRRQVLRGLGGLTLGLPLLPSLMPGRAYAVEYALARQPSFVAMTTIHGACRPENLYPAATALTDSTEVYPGYTVKHGKLTPEGGRLSNVIRGAALTPALAAKMNVLRGFDYPYYSGHHSGQLGNFAVNDQGPAGLTPWVSIDQVMAYSSTFYPGAIKVRSITTGRGGFQQPCSFTYSNIAAKTGVQRTPIESSTGALFDKLFGGGGGMPGAPARPPIVDRVLASYKRLREGDRRLSAEDRRRLDDHVARIGELEKQIKTAPAADCGTPMRPAESNGVSDAGDSGKRFYGLLNDVIAAALACGSSRIATIAIPHGSFNNNGGGYHQGVAHNAGSAGAQATVVAVHQAVFEHVFLDLMKKLDALTLAPGRTALDDTLVQWTQEAGWNTHDAQDSAILMAGSAAGFFKTGLFVDYRSTRRMKMFGSLQQQQLGLLHRQWLATALQAMGIPRTEFEKNGKQGYGDPFMSGDYTAAQLAAVYEKASSPVPVITNG